MASSQSKVDGSVTGYTTRVTSSGASRPEDFPIPDAKTTKEQSAPVFHGGIPLSKAALASEAHPIRHTIPEKYQRISRPVPMMRLEYDAVVIGSGYGGAIAASRMARANKSVCVLELGKERWPGEYPAGFTSAAPDIHVTGKLELSSKLTEINAGDAQGLYHLIVGEGQNAFVANGLGGTSLLNANVFLQADHRTLSQNVFPPEIRKDPAQLDEYYELARQVLQPEHYPQDFPKLPKLEVLGEQAKLLGPDFEERFSRVPQTTTFKDGYNNTGVYQKKSTLSGQDSTGVNDGSKNSTLMNYLPDAWNNGAEIFCGCEVRYIKPCREGKNKWTIFFAWYGDKRGEFKDKIYSDLMWVQAKEFVFLGAGTLGTTEILLRSRAYGLKLSPSLGMNMSGNGDILAFGYNSKKICNPIGTENQSYLKQHPVGPTINGVIDMRDEEVAPNVLDGYVIEEGAVPEALAPFLQTMFDLIPDKIAPKEKELFQSFHELAAEASSRFLGPWSQGGSLNKSMIYLIMSHDDNQATMTLVDNKPYLQFLGVARSQHVEFLNGILAKATNMIGAEFIPNPFSAKELGNAEITVHPIGGASMSGDGTGESGVTNHFGQLFTGIGSEVYKDLVVVDGAVVPAALGVNPFATISAFAERSVRGVAAERGIKVDYESKNGVINWASPKKMWPLADDMVQAQKEIANSPMTGGARFTEIMEGYFYVGDDIEDYAIAVEAAKGACSSARFYLSVDAWDINTLISKDNHAAMLTGTFSCGALSKDPFMVLRGEFQLFSQDPRTPDTDNLAYNFDMVSTSGEIIHFYGFKVVDPSIAFSASNTWKATTTLYITLSRPDKSVIGRGILTISVKNFADELLSFEGIGESEWTKLVSARRFLSYFTEKLATSFFAPLDPMEYPPPVATSFVEKYPPTEVFTVTASDGVKSVMLKWVPKSGKTDMPILLVPGAAGDHQIYALPTIPFHFVGHLLDRGYTVYNVTSRIGKSPNAKDNWTGYDARLDVAAATEYILKDTKAPKIYVVAHCLGSIATACGLLDGTIKGIGGLTVSQVFLQPYPAQVTGEIARLDPPLTSVYQKFYGPWYDLVLGDDRKFMDAALRVYPVGGTKEVCQSIICHRADLVFGRLWTHANLNEATHQNLGSFFGGVSMKSLDLLRTMSLKNHVMDNNYTSLLTDENIKRLSGIPIFFIHGGMNTVWSPQSTMMDYDLLREKLDPSLYERWVFEDKGHLDPWMGKSSFMDVYPRVEEHARKIIQKEGLKGGK